MRYFYGGLRAKCGGRVDEKGGIRPLDPAVRLPDLTHVIIIVREIA